MVDRLLKLSVLPICVSMLFGVVLIGPQLRNGDDTSDVTHSAPSGSSNSLSSLDAPREPDRLQPYPAIGEIDGIDSSDPTHVDSIDLTDALNGSWDQASLDRELDNPQPANPDSFVGGFADRDSNRNSKTTPPATENRLSLNNADSPLVDPTRSSQNNSMDDSRRPAGNESFADAFMDNGQRGQQSPNQNIQNQTNSNQDYVVERFPQGGTLYNNPLQSSIAPPQRPNGTSADWSQENLAAQDANLRLPQHVVDRLQQQLDSAAILARKGALFSARNEFIHTLYLIAEARDSMLGSRAATRQLEGALTAMRESDDFSRNHQSRDYHLDIARIVGRHQTPVLEGEVGNPITPLEAMRRYYEFAGINLMSAFGQEPIAASALHSLGKLHIMPGGLGENGEAYAVPKAVVFFQAAVTINPADSKSANELGVQLARLGEWGGAKQAFLQSVAAAPSVVAWQNLAVVHQHLNEIQLAQLAENEAQLLARQQQQTTAPQISTAAGPVEFIEPNEFASQSPMHSSYVGDTRRSRAPETPSPTPNRTADRKNSGSALWDWF